MAEYTIDLLIALEKGERLTRPWWRRRYLGAAERAGGMPAEVAEPECVSLTRVTDPETGDRYARLTFPLPAQTDLARARELAHMLTSVLVGEGWTLRLDGERVETLPGSYDGEPRGELGPADFTAGRVCSDRCMACVMAGENRIGCCTEGSAFSLADLGAALLAGDESLVTRCLSLPGARDGDKWHPHLSGGKCVFHDPSRGCTLPPARMPLQCRTFLCSPGQLLPPAVLAEYDSYVDGLEEQEDFVSEHMRRSGADFGSPLPALKAAAARAFSAWAAGERELE